VEGKREKSRIYVFWPLIVIAYCTTVSGTVRIPGVLSTQIRPTKVKFYYSSLTVPHAYVESGIIKGCTFVKAQYIGNGA
jgi:hypothetical protein